MGKIKEEFMQMRMQEQAAIEELRSMDDVLPRPTPDAQLELLQRITQQGSTDAPEEVAEEFKLS